MTSTSRKTVVVLSKAYDAQMAMQLNGIGHLSMAMGMTATDSQRASYTCRDGYPLGTLSWWPLIVLSGRPGKIAGFWQSLSGGPLAHACFTESMVYGGSEAQLAATAELATQDQSIIAIAAHGPANEIDVLAKRFSLWKAPQHTAIQS